MKQPLRRWVRALDPLLMPFALVFVLLALLWALRPAFDRAG